MQISVLTEIHNEDAINNSLFLVFLATLPSHFLLVSTVHQTPVSGFRLINNSNKEFYG